MIKMRRSLLQITLDTQADLRTLYLIKWGYPSNCQNFTAWKVPNTELFLARISGIRIECRKIRTRNNSVFGHFSPSVCPWDIHIIDKNMFHLLFVYLLVYLLVTFSTYLLGLKRLPFAIDVNIRDVSLHMFYFVIID